MSTPDDFKAAWIADLKTRSTLTALVGSEIRETEYQSDEWTYPNVRVSLVFRPSKIYCGPDDATVDLEIFSAEKSSKEAVHIASVILGLYHGKPFTANGVHFNTVAVQEISKPERTIYSWMVRVNVLCQGTS